MGKPSRFYAWIDRLKARGGAPYALLTLDVIEPIAPLLAQAVWMGQPLAGLWHGREDAAELAQLLEAPDGIDRLRQRLADE